MKTSAIQVLTVVGELGKERFQIRGRNFRPRQIQIAQRDDRSHELLKGDNRNRRLLGKLEEELESAALDTNAYNGSYLIV